MRFNAAEQLAFRPPEEIAVSEWAAKRRVLARHAAIKGPYSLAFVPFFVPIMDACASWDINEVVVQKPAQIGGTDAFVNVIGYYFDQEPSSIMMVLADEETANYVCSEKITAMFLDSPYLREAYFDPNTFTKTEIKAPNGAYLSIGWASSVSKMGTKPMRVVIFDEVNKPGYSITTKEASPLSLGRERTNTYPAGYKKHILLSTPTDEQGNITVELDSCDVIYDWHVPCPACRDMQPLRWSADPLYTWGFEKGMYRAEDGAMRPFGGVVWQDGRNATKEQILKTARYKCGSCGSLWSDSEKNEAVRNGKMVPRTQPKGTEKKIGFHINRLYSLFDGGRITKIVEDWVGIHKLTGLTKRGAIQGFINSTLAEPFRQIVIETSEKKILQARCDLPPQTVPETAVALTCGIDRQKYGFYFVVRAFDQEYTSWLIHYGFLPTWADVEALLFETRYPVRGTGARLPIWRAAIDTGGSDLDADTSMTEDTYWWLINSIGRGVSIWGTKGSSHAIPGRFKAGAQLRKTPSGKPLPHWFHIILIDTATMKDAYHYAIDQAIAGEQRAAYLHAETREDYARQIMAEEKRRTPKGTIEWVRTKPDNHYFDAEVLAMSVAHPDWMGGGVNLIRDPVQAKPKTPNKGGATVARSSWMNRR